MSENTVFQLLTEPFPDDDHEWLTQKSYDDVGQKLVVPYIRKPAIIHRLDSVLGFGNYAFTVEQVYSQKEDERRYSAAYIASLKLLVNGNWITFSDVGVNVAFKRDVADKGASTDAIKRAAKLAGIGLYLDTGGLYIRIPTDSVDPRISFFGSRAVTLHPSLKVPFGQSRGKTLEELDGDTLDGLFKWLKTKDRYKGDEYLFRLFMSIKSFFDKE